MSRILITGGAGFIGSRLAMHLTSSGHEVTIYDNFTEQVHGVEYLKHKMYLEQFAEVVVDDVRNHSAFGSALSGVEILIHLAAETGTTQSMSDASRYIDVNVKSLGAVVETLVEGGAENLRKIILASSRAIYGEGMLSCDICGERTQGSGISTYGYVCSNCGSSALLIGTKESDPQAPKSIYGLTKKHQEEYLSILAKQFKLEVYALRFQNVYGAGQSLRNPYTGVLSIFCGMLFDGLNLEIYQRGLPVRDFVHIDDVVLGINAAVNDRSLTSDAGFRALNIGSGSAASIKDAAMRLAKMALVYGRSCEVFDSEEERSGDVLGCFADISVAKDCFGWTPQISMDDGLKLLLDWSFGMFESEGVSQASSYLKTKEKLTSLGLIKNVTS